MRLSQMDETVKIQAYLDYFMGQFYKASGDTHLNKLISENGIVAGGAIRSLFNSLTFDRDENINDIDIYFSDINALKKVFKILSNKKLTNGIDILCESENAITCIDSESRVKYQFIKTHVGDFTTIFERFDFTNSMASYDLNTRNMCFHDDFHHSNEYKVLQFNTDCINALSSVNRLTRFIKEGYTIDSNNMLKLIDAAAKCGKQSRDNFLNSDNYYGKGY